ncbi:MAG: GNAT family N-acetyltransferase [Proteobacteria bacterium]|nr:GNAT family N-acetyltransferase [Pseudomonadota bacterium]
MIKIRRARINDVESLADLLISFHKYFQGLDHESHRIMRAKITDEITRLSFAGRPLLYIFVAESDGHVAGAVSFYNGWTTDASTMYHIPYLFLRPEFRGGRIAFALLRHVRDLARKTNVKRICFSVYGKNAPARKLYEHIGAKYWATAEDEHFMFYDV